MMTTPTTLAAALERIGQLEAQLAISTGQGVVSPAVWAERVACARMCDKFAHEEGPGERRYSGNVMSARILGRTDGQRVAPQPV